MDGAAPGRTGLILQRIEQHLSEAQGSSFRDDIDVFDERLGAAVLVAIAEAEHPIPSSSAINFEQQDDTIRKSGLEHQEQPRHAFVRQRVIVLGVKGARELSDDCSVAHRRAPHKNGVIFVILDAVAHVVACLDCDPRE